MITDHVFIGGGVGNLAAANYLLDSGASKILVIEKGLPTSERRCPGAPQNTCIHCRKGCEVTEGLGGSNALFGNKLCYFPASAGILRVIPKDTLSKAVVYLEELLAPYFSAKYICEDRDFLFRKDYYSDVLSQGEFTDMIARMTSRLHAGDLLRLKTPVVDVRKTAGVFVITTAEGQEIKAGNVIVGTGRTSQSWLRQTLQSLRVAYSEQTPDVGIRIEADAEVFGENYYYQIDPKYKFDFPPHGSARSFCAHNRGVVVPVQFGGTFYADGAFPAKFTRENNIAMMTRTHEPISLRDLESWCGDVNKFAAKTLVMADIHLNGCEPASSIAAAIVSTIPSWPSPSHHRLMLLLIERLFGEPIRLMRCDTRSKNRFRIYAPAIDRFWPVPQLGENFESSCTGLFVLGDAAGLSRGFVQAMTSGVAWALTRCSNGRNQAGGVVCSALA